MLTGLMRRSTRGERRGQAMTELALVAPLFLMVLFGVIVLGVGIFYQQQLTNAAREGARYATVHTASSRCPTVSNLVPDPALLPNPNNYYACDGPATRWPLMTGQARSALFGLTAGSVQATACWSGYWTKDTNGAWADYDQVAFDAATGSPNTFRDCTIRVYGWTPGQDIAVATSSLQVINPRTGRNAADETITVDCSRQFPLTTSGDDMASSFSASNGEQANQVTVLTCYAWKPPLAGFLLIPRTVHLTGVITEALEYQQ